MARAILNRLVSEQSLPPWPGVVELMEGDGASRASSTPCSARCSRSSAGETSGSGETKIAQVEAQHPGDVIVYEDAGHGFMRDGSESYHETAAADAWTRLLAFLQQDLRD